PPAPPPAAAPAPPPPDYGEVVSINSSIRGDWRVRLLAGGKRLGVKLVAGTTPVWGGIQLIDLTGRIVWQTRISGNGNPGTERLFALPALTPGPYRVNLSGFAGKWVFISH
ncbi:MAG: hypothetical protein AAFN92_17600, partial [Bacteroidota bacterium]